MIEVEEASAGASITSTEERRHTRLAYERLIADELAQWADPNAKKRFRQIEKRARKEFKQKFFSKPGRGLPQRLPDLGAVGGYPPALRL